MTVEFGISWNVFLIFVPIRFRFKSTEELRTKDFLNKYNHDYIRCVNNYLYDDNIPCGNKPFIYNGYLVYSKEIDGECRKIITRDKLKCMIENYESFKFRLYIATGYSLKNKHKYSYNKIELDIEKILDYFKNIEFVI